MPVEACSGDEDVSSPAGKITVIIKPDWRSEGVRLWFRAFNVLNMAYRYRDGFPKRGNWPKYRVQTNPVRKDTRHRLVCRLPRNFYDDKWYNSLNDMDKKIIDAQKELNLDFPAEVET